MKLLLDTHILLWAAGQPDRLSPAARDLLLDPGTGNRRKRGGPVGPPRFRPSSGRRYCLRSLSRIICFASLLISTRSLLSSARPYHVT